MPRLLDTRLIGRDIADVATTSYGSNTAPGSLLQVARDGISMQIGPNSDLAYISKDAEQDRSGISLQQYLASSWTNITPGLFSQVYDVTYAGGLFWAVGANGSAGVIASSPIVNTTGSSIVTAVWTEQPHNFTGPIFGITFENGVLVACGSNGQIGVYNGTAWNLVRNGGTASIYRIAYGHRKGWVAVGTATSVSTSAGVTFVSEDAQTWMDTAPALGVGVPIYGVAYGDGQFMAVGGAAGVATNHIATSENGMTWTTRTSSSPTSAHYAVAYGNNRWVVGGNNVIVHSGGGVTWNSVAAAGNIQSVIYGNGMFVCSSTIVYGSVNGQEFAVLDDSTGFTATAAGGCYGNGLFVVGSRAGQIIRSGTAPETIGGAPGRDGRDGVNGTPGSAQTVVTRNTSANEAITNSVQSYVYILNQAPPSGSLVTLVLNVPVNTSNTVERFFVNVRHPETGAVYNQIAFITGALGGLLRGGAGVVGADTSFFVLPMQYGPVLVEFYRFPNTSDWYYDTIYWSAGPIPPESCSGTCVMSGSVVSMADGTAKAVETLVPGDLVWDQYQHPVEVVSLIPVRLGNRSIFRINNELGITSDHPIMTTRGWAAVDTAAILHLNDQFFDYGSHQYKAAYACVKAQQVGQLNEQSVVFLENSMTAPLQISQPEHHDANTPVYAVALKNADSLIINGVVNGAYNAERII